MTDHSAPGVYTQPGGDADDVLGHRAAFDAQPDFRALDKKSAHDDDVEGHRLQDRLQDKVTQAADDRVIYEHDEDDVEGHRLQAPAGADFRAAADRVV